MGGKINYGGGGEGGVDGGGKMRQRWGKEGSKMA